jgi:hypothetical protein
MYLYSISKRGVFFLTNRQDAEDTELRVRESSPNDLGVLYKHL